MKRAFFAMFLVLFALPLVTAVTINSLALSPANATTTNTLDCSVNASGAAPISADITWFKNGASHGTDDETLALQTDVTNATSSIGDIEAIDTTKGDVWICQATVTDGVNTTSLNSSSLTIVNSPPTITFPTITQSVIEDTSYNQNATTTDADGDSILTFISADLNSSQFNGNSLFTITNAGLISFTPDQNATGNHTMAILAFDGDSWGGANVVYTIVQVNDSPAFQASLTNQSGSVAQSFSYSITGYDEENDTFNFSVSASRPTVIITQTSATQANLSFSGGSPIIADQGLIEINVTIYAEGNTSSNTTSTFYINVTQPDAVPVFVNASNSSGVQGALFTFYINASDADINDTVNFTTSASCSLTNPWTIVTLNNNSTDAYGLINITLTNDHVACPSVTFTARDYLAGTARGGVNTTTLYFNITNTNDQPIIYNISRNASNSFSETDLRNLTASTYTPFLYTVNATDPDMLTYAGDTITFSDNTSLFDIDSNTGLISFTPGLSDVGNHLVNITVTDLNGSMDSVTLNLTILNDGYPIVTPIGTITCAEDSLCVYNFSASDPDEPENITFTFNDSLVSATQLALNISQLSHTYTNNQVGVYTINITATDAYLHQNSTTFTLNITNTNDAPYFDNDLDNFSDTLVMPFPVVVGFPTYWLINTTDPDLPYDATESMTYTTNITSGANSSLFSISKLNNTQALISFTPDVLDIGNYTVNITVIDAYGLNASQSVSFTVYNASLAPTIDAVQPFYNGTAQVNSTLTTTSASSTNVSFPENTTITFNLSYTDVDTLPGNMLIRYYRNGTLMSTQDGNTPSYSWTPGFFDSGTYNITALVQDNLLSADNFTWLVTVTNVNRAPVLVSSVPNRTINMTASLSREMAHFLDPDDDLNSNGILDLSETSNLVFTASSTPLLSISFSGIDVYLQPVQSGVTDVYYTATDTGSLSVGSNNVTYIVFYFPSTTPTPTSGGTSGSGGGGGGGGGGGSQIITKKIKEPDPYAIDIIVPRALTIYENATVIAPIDIVNTGKVSLHDIKLSARTDANVTLTWLDDSIDLLEVNETYNTSLAITNYKYGGTFEVYVTGSVTKPDFNDSAVLYINSIEKGSEGAAVNVKITYARDLLAANPACGELVQLVNQAEQALRNGDTKSAQELLAAVDEGCAFLKAQASKEMHTPGLLQTLAGFQYVNVILGGFLLVLLIVGGMLVAHYAKQQ